LTYGFTSLSFITIGVLGISDCRQKESIIGEYDDRFNPLLNLLLDTGLVCTWTLEQVLVIDEALMLILLSPTGVNERTQSTEDQCLVVFKEDELSDILME
jgi:hypothetical protein